MSWIVSGICGCIIIYLAIQLNKKQTIERDEYERYQKDLVNVQVEYKKIKEQESEAQSRLITAENKYNKLVEEYQQNQEHLDEYFEAQRVLKNEALERLYNAKLEVAQKNLDEQLAICKAQLADAQNELDVAIMNMNAQREELLAENARKQLQMESVLAPLRLYEKERQERLFYTIQVPDEYKPDIEFLLTTVAQKVQHPDVINKLVWAEYVKPYLDDTFKRVGINDMPGIYKLTNLDSGKAYIGKSTNIKKRIADHFKSAVGIDAIADQAVHHAILDTGFWNWSIECIINCDKDQLSEYEKYYINFFKTQEFGFNKNVGG